MLSEFAVFAQSMSQNVIVGGDFKTLLNSPSHVDEKSITQLLPFRAGQKGLHLIEAISGIVRNLRDLEREKLTAGEDPSITLIGKVAELTKHFSADLEALKARLESGVELSREVMVLQDPANELLVISLLEAYVPFAEPPKRAGWFGRLFGR